MKKLITTVLLAISLFFGVATSVSAIDYWRGTWKIKTAFSDTLYLNGGTALAITGRDGYGNALKGTQKGSLVCVSQDAQTAGSLDFISTNAWCFDAKTGNAQNIFSYTDWTYGEETLETGIWAGKASKITRTDTKTDVDYQTYILKKIQAAKDSQKAGN